ncbi:hypothetical protein [Edaphobacter bradus]|uniref:hypothetical protein n=1 Tax=Edaphobacter bradus TaxID=2259016 RepID=UPI0021DFB33D|nr:hypothetical protein [Edaphobacter bradus]
MRFVCLFRSSCLLSALAVTLSTTCSTAYATPPDDPPACGSAGNGGKRITIEAATLGESQYTDPGSGSSVVRPRTFANGDQVVFVLKDINPFLQRCTLTVNSTKVQESANASILSLIGGPLADLSSSQPSQPPSKGGTAPPANLLPQAVIPQPAGKERPAPPPKPKPTLQSCRDTYHQLSGYQTWREIFGSATILTNSINDAVTAVNGSAQEFNTRFSKVLTPSKCSTLIPNIDAITETSVKLPDLNVKFNKDDDSGGDLAASLDRKPASDAANSIANAAVLLHGTLADGVEAECQSLLKDDIANDKQQLETIFDASQKSAQILAWQSKLGEISTRRQQVADAVLKVHAVAGKQGSFYLSHEFDRAENTQATDTVTVSCSSVDTSQYTIAAQGASPAPAGGNPTLASQPASPPSSGQSAGSDPAPGGSDSSTLSRTYTYQFGHGQRTFIAGGISIAPLGQHSYTTGSSTDSSKTIIIDQDNGSTRLLPMALVHVRYSDFERAATLRPYLPKYLSAGLTAKPDATKGTSVEYLFGLSWASPGRYAFLTIGAYSGAVQQLQSGLKVGDTTSLAAASLPIAKPYHWKLGVAISFTKPSSPSGPAPQ